jgi:hypothetical protein
MMETFCAGSNLRVSLELPGCPSILARCLNIVQKRLGQEVRGTLMSDISILDSRANGTLPAPGRRVTLDLDIRMALEERLISEAFPPSTVTEAHSYADLKINGLQYADKNTTEGNGIIFFRPTGAQDLVPAVIRQMFSIGASSDAEVFLAIHRYLPVEESDTLENPFKQNPDHGLSLWQSQTNQSVEVIRSTQDICHGNQCVWQKDVVVMRPTHRVRRPLLRYYGVSKLLVTRFS